MAWTPEDIAEAMAEFAGVFWPEATIGPVGELVDQIPESHYEFTITDGDRLLTVNVREEEKG